MKTVLVSIHPRWCKEIFVTKRKTIEVRKNRPRLETPFTVYVYQTKHKCEKGDSRLVCDALDELLGGGKVIGSFVCNKIYSFITFGAGAACIDSDWKQVSPERVIKETCLSEEQIMDYLEQGIGNYEGYGWHITEPKLFDKPRDITEFAIFGKCADECSEYDFCARDIAEDRMTCKCFKRTFLTRPPQSWCYVEAYRDDSGDHDTHYGI